MNARLAALLTAAHAPAWQRRYGAEFRALLEELPATPAVVASAGGSALSSQSPALVAIGAFALAAAVLALGPAASDRRLPAAQIRSHPSIPSTMLACDGRPAHVASDGSLHC